MPIVTVPPAMAGQLRPLSVPAEMRPLAAQVIERVGPKTGEDYTDIAQAVQAGELDKFRHPDVNYKLDVNDVVTKRLKMLDEIFLSIDENERCSVVTDLAMLLEYSRSRTKRVLALLKERDSAERIARFERLAGLEDVASALAALKGDLAVRKEGLWRPLHKYLDPILGDITTIIYRVYSNTINWGKRDREVPDSGVKKGKMALYKHCETLFTLKKEITAIVQNEDYDDESVRVSDVKKGIERLIKAARRAGKLPEGQGFPVRKNKEILQRLEAIDLGRFRK